MRSSLRIAALILVILALLLPLATTYASGGPCPDDPELSKTCYQTAPPFYVVINRTFDALDRPGTGCQPIILKNPDCKDCCGADESCWQASYRVETEVCPMLAARVDWMDAQQTETVYEMCCDCAYSSQGDWVYRTRLLHSDGTCPIVDGEYDDCLRGLPPGTDIDLPAPFIVGGLAVLGAGLLAAGLLVRRRTVRTA